MIRLYKNLVDKCLIELSNEMLILVAAGANSIQVTHSFEETIKALVFRTQANVKGSKFCYLFYVLCLKF
jgi:hypothetical protein